MRIHSDRNPDAKRIRIRNTNNDNVSHLDTTVPYAPYNFPICFYLPKLSSEASFMIFYHWPNLLFVLAENFSRELAVLVRSMQRSGRVVDSLWVQLPKKNSKKGFDRFAVSSALDLARLRQLF